MPNFNTKSHHRQARTTDSILFVCALNTCRSIGGHAVFDYIKNETSLALRIESAGIWAYDGQPCNSEMKDAAAKRGYDLSTYRSTPLQALDPDDYSQVFIFEQAHFEPVCHWMSGSDRPEYLMTYSKYFGNQEVLMQETVDSVNIYTHIFDLIEDGCLGFYNQLSIEGKSNDL